MSDRAYELGPREEECDLVMKGGITSGVVYPSAIRKIAGRYRFRNLGGASAGAIAAVAAAACEYRWNQGEPAAYDALGEVSDEITQQGFVLSLFQPTPAARPAFDVALRFVTSKGSLARRAPAAMISILRGRKLFLAAAALAVLAWLAIIVVAVWALAGGGLSALDWVAIVLLVVATLVAVPALLLLVALVALGRFALALNGALSANWIGMCTGRTESGQPEHSGLTDWLHKTIQHCAGLPLDQPLTFRMLQGEDPKNPDVNLALVTTDLSASRPVTLPFSEPDEEQAPYLFDPEELGRLFPPEVVTQMTEATQAGARKYKAGGKERTLYPVPGLDLPLVVAARLSLSFPVLLSTVPLWRNDPLRGPVRHTMSDGGICSNFPIHFFDSLFPSRPTFGLDLQPWRRPDLPRGRDVRQPAHAGLHEGPRRHEDLPAAPERRAQLARQHAGRAAGLPRPRVPDPPDGRRGRPEPEHAERSRGRTHQAGPGRGRAGDRSEGLRLEPPSRHAVLDHDADAPAEPRRSRRRPGGRLPRRSDGGPSPVPGRRRGVEKGGLEPGRSAPARVVGVSDRRERRTVRPGSDVGPAGGARLRHRRPDADADDPHFASLLRRFVPAKARRGCYPGRPSSETSSELLFRALHS